MPAGNTKGQAESEFRCDRGKRIERERSSRAQS